MTQIKLEHIDNLRRWKKSGANIGSRWIPHHLYAHEQIHYEQALKHRYLEISDKHRINLQNLWYQICLTKKWKNYVLVKNTQHNIAQIFLDDTLVISGPIDVMKQEIKKRAQ